MSREYTDYYALLGVGRGASAADVDRAYRRAARATHPDVHPDDGSAAERFRAVAIAYETLSDPRLRAAYDDAHPPVRRSTPIAVQYRREPVTPVHLGRRKPQAEPLQPFRDSSARVRTVRAHTDDIFELAEALSRLLFDRAFP
jgi:curved DNA-binding protein CbpA